MSLAWPTEETQTSGQLTATHADTERTLITMHNLYLRMHQ